MNNFLVVYVDGVLLTLNTLEEHRKHLNLFIEMAIEEGICLGEKKTIIEKETIESLAFKVGTNRVSLQPHISRKINENPNFDDITNLHFSINNRVIDTIKKEMVDDNNV